MNIIEGEPNVTPAFQKDPSLKNVMLGQLQNDADDMQKLIKIDVSKNGNLLREAYNNSVPVGSSSENKDQTVTTSPGEGNVITTERNERIQSIKQQLDDLNIYYQPQGMGGGLMNNREESFGNILPTKVSEKIPPVEASPKLSKHLQKINQNSSTSLIENGGSSKK